MKPAPICYVEIPAPDIEKAGSFYSSVFGWTVSPSNLGDQPYWMFKAGEGQLMGGFDSSKPVQPGGVILYLKVDNIEAALTLVKEKGGAILREKFDIGGGYGFSAIFKDPNGNHVGLWAER